LQRITLTSPRLPVYKGNNFGVPTAQRGNLDLNELNYYLYRSLPPLLSSLINRTQEPRNFSKQTQMSDLGSLFRLNTGALRENKQKADSLAWVSAQATLVQNISERQVTSKTGETETQAFKAQQPYLADFSLLSLPLTSALTSDGIHLPTIEEIQSLEQNLAEVLPSKWTGLRLIEEVASYNPLKNWLWGKSKNEIIKLFKGLIKNHPKVFSHFSDPLNGLTSIRLVINSENSLVNIGGFRLRYSSSGEPQHDHWQIIGQHIPISDVVELGIFSALKQYGESAQEKRFTTGNFIPITWQGEHTQRFHAGELSSHHNTLQNLGWEFLDSNSGFLPHANTVYRNAIHMIESGMSFLEAGMQSNWQPAEAETTNVIQVPVDNRSIKQSDPFTYQDKIGKLDTTQQAWLLQRLLGVLPADKRRPPTPKFINEIVNPISKQLKTKLDKPIKPEVLKEVLVFEPSTQNLQEIVIPQIASKEDIGRLQVAQEILKLIRQSSTDTLVSIAPEFLEVKEAENAKQNKTQIIKIVSGRPPADVYKLPAAYLNGIEAALEQLTVDQIRDLALFVINGWPYQRDFRALRTSAYGELARNANKLKGVNTSKIIGAANYLADRGTAQALFGVKSNLIEILLPLLESEVLEFPIAELALYASCIPAKSIVTNEYGQIRYFTEAGLAETPHGESGALKFAQLLIERYLNTTPDVSRVRYNFLQDVKNYQKALTWIEQRILDKVKEIESQVESSGEGSTQAVLNHKRRSFLQFNLNELHLIAHRFELSLEDIVEPLITEYSDRSMVVADAFLDRNKFELFKSFIAEQESYKELLTNILKLIQSTSKFLGSIEKKSVD
jgi:hypothetical protein